MSDIKDPFELVRLAEASGNRDFLEQARSVAEQYGGPGALEYVSCYMGEDLGSEGDPNYEGKLSALKYAINHKRGMIYTPGNVAGDLYRELFWDDDADGVFLRELPKQQQQIWIGTLLALNESSGVEDAENRIQDAYRALVNRMLGINLQLGMYDKRLRPLAEAVDMFEDVQNAFRPVVGKLGSNGSEKAREAAEKIASALAIE